MPHGDGVAALHGLRLAQSSCQAESGTNVVGRRDGNDPAIGGRALVVHGIDVAAAAFWRRRGFLPSKDDPLVLFRSLPDIVASLLAAR